MKRLKKICTVIIALLLVLYLGLVVVAFLPQETIPVSQLAGPQDKFITVNGQTIHYLQQGIGKPLILVHGFAGSTYTWRKLIPLLADRYTVYALDLLGFGLSDKPEDGNYDLEAQGKLVIGFMDALHLPSATLAGHSMGGVVVGYAALDAPAKVDALILVSPGFYGKGAPSFLRYLFFPLDRVMARKFYKKAVRAASLSRSFYNKSLVTDELIDAYLLPTKTPHAADALARMMSSTRTYEGLAEKIATPSLLVWGDHDTNNLPQDGDRLKKEIKQSRLVTIKECGHYVQEEKPEELARAIKDFLG
ncbi:MAG: alpha/beta fold hydrolase [Proteobacteria bacterium]|nr:alpha/beta fold hydrolase [Pseudomonadota bacterium]